MAFPIRVPTLSLMALLPAFAAAQALYEVGENDRVLIGSQAYYPGHAAAHMAYAPDEQAVLVAWSGRHALGAGDWEIRYERIDAESGESLGEVRTIVTGASGFDDTWGIAPSVAYNPDLGEFLIVFVADEPGDGHVEGEREIFAQRIAASTGEPAGAKVRISGYGSDGDLFALVTRPIGIYNPTEQEYLVAWVAFVDDGVSGGDVVVQRLDAATLDERGADDFVINAAGNGNVANVSNVGLDLAWNADDNQYLVVWAAGVAIGADDRRILGQRLDGDNAEQIGDNDFTISGAAETIGSYPAVQYNPVQGEYLVIWTGENPGVGGLVDNEIEILGQRLTADGIPIGTPRFPVSDAGGVSSTQYVASISRLAYDETRDRYLATWLADDIGDAIADNEVEVYVQALSADGSQIGPNDLRISDMGEDGDPEARAWSPAVVATADGYWVSWVGDEPPNVNPYVHLQRLAGPDVFADGFENP